MKKILKITTLLLLMITGIFMACENELQKPEFSNLYPSEIEVSDCEQDFKFEIAIYTTSFKTGDHKLTKAQLMVLGDGMILYDKTLPADTMKIVLPCGYMDYEIKVLKSGWKPLSSNYTYEELKWYKSKGKSPKYKNKKKGKGNGTIKKKPSKHKGPLLIYLEKGLFLWNQLGSTEQFANSPIGPNVNPANINNFLPAMFGNGTKPLNGSYIPTVSNQKIVDYMPNPLLQPWTIEVWFKPDYSVSNNRIVGNIPYERSHIIVANCWNWDGAIAGIRIMPIKNGYGGPTDVYADLSYYRSLGDYNILNPDIIDNDVSWNAGDLVHLAVVFDPETIDGETKFQFYVDGVLHGHSSVTFIDDYFEPIPGWPFMIGGHQHRVAQGVVDNLKMYDYAKTDFSDRFKE